MTGRFLCDGPSGSTVCLDTSAALLAGTVRNEEVNIGPAGDANRTAYTTADMFPDARTLHQAVDQQRQVTVGWCALMQEEGLLCPNCPLRAYIPTPETTA